MNYDSAEASRRASRSDEPSSLSRARGASQPVPSDALDSPFTGQTSDFTVSSAHNSLEDFRRATASDLPGATKQSYSRTSPSEGSRVRRSIVDGIQQSSPNRHSDKTSDFLQRNEQQPHRQSAYAVHDENQQERQSFPSRRRQHGPAQGNPYHNGAQIAANQPTAHPDYESALDSPHKPDLPPRRSRTIDNNSGETHPVSYRGGTDSSEGADNSHTISSPHHINAGDDGVELPPVPPRRSLSSRSKRKAEKENLKKPELSEVAPGRYKKKRSKTWLAIREVLMVLIVAITISALIKAFLIQAFIIPSESMEDTLLPQDRVLVSKLVPSFRQVNRGDILVFEDKDNWLNVQHDTSPVTYVKRVLIALGLRPDDSQNHLIKRVIGLPGDHVQCCDKNGNLVVNGISVKEPYLKPGVNPSDISFDVYVPADKLWMMGDNRANSGDSRAHMESESQGFVDMSSVTGRAFVIMWPYSRWKTLSNSDAFAAVPSLPK